MYLSDQPLGDLVRAYLGRVVNGREVAAVDDLVAPSYRGSGPGWPTDLAGLRALYADQAVSRPDWRIDVQQTMEVGEYVAVHAYAGGTVGGPEGGGAHRRDLEWLAVYRVEGGLISEIRVVTVEERAP